ncbi:hypothetical protein N9I65_02660 [bacterium]|nr:hypothetical protein [bacterium]
MFFSPIPSVFDSLTEKQRDEFCRPIRSRISSESLDSPSKRWLKKAEKEFPLYEVTRRSRSEPLEQRWAYEFDLGDSIVGLNFISPNGRLSALPFFIHIAYAFRKKKGANTFKNLQRLIQLLEEGENSFSFLFIAKIGGNFFPFLESGEAHDWKPAPREFLFNSFEELGFERTNKTIPMFDDGQFLIRSFEAQNPSSFTLFLSKEDAENRFSKFEREFGDYDEKFRKKEGKE